MTGGVDSRGKRPLILGRSLSYPKYFRSDCTILPLHRRFEEAIVHFIVALDLKAVTQILTDRLRADVPYDGAVGGAEGRTLDALIPKGGLWQLFRAFVNKKLLAVVLSDQPQQFPGVEDSRTLPCFWKMPFITPQALQPASMQARCFFQRHRDGDCNRKPCGRFRDDPGSENLRHGSRGNQRVW